LFNSRAVVYFYDQAKKNWAPTEVPGFCRMDMYFNAQTNFYRVIARGADNPNQVVINSAVSKETTYGKASASFGQWTDTKKTVWGFNFPSEADASSFATSFEDILKKLANPAAAPAPTPTPAPAKAAPGPPAAPKGPPAPPSAPKAPPAPKVGGGGGEPRGALLSSIQGFSSSGLKKAVTVDKSSPIIGPEPGAAAARPGTPSSGGDSGGAPAPRAAGGDMMSEMMAKRNAMKKAPAEAPVPVAAAPKSAVPGPKVPGPKAPVPMPGKVSAPAPSVPAPAAHAPAPAVHAPTPVSHQSASSGNLSPEFEALKNEIMEEVRREIQAAKAEILAAMRR